MKISMKARERVKALLKSAAPGQAFLVEVQAGGCSGFQYKFSMGIPEADAEIHRFEGGVVSVEALSAPLLEDAELDWEQSTLRNGPVVKNTAATSSCGCGLSFS